MDVLFDQEMANEFSMFGLVFPNWIIGLTAKEVGLGVPKWWLFPYSHKLTPAAIIHDLEYEKKIERTSKNADLRFKKNCLTLAKRNLILIAQSYVFYSIVRSWGEAHWLKKNSKSYFRTNG